MKQTCPANKPRNQKNRFFRVIPQVNLNPLFRGFKFIVRVVGVEPTASSLSEKRSTAELHARFSPLAFYVSLYDSARTYFIKNFWKNPAPPRRFVGAEKKLHENLPRFARQEKKRKTRRRAGEKWARIFRPLRLFRFPFFGNFFGETLLKMKKLFMPWFNNQSYRKDNQINFDFQNEICIFK